MTWLIFHICWLILGGKNNFPQKCSKKGLVLEKNKLVFLLHFPENRGGVRPEFNFTLFLPFVCTDNRPILTSPQHINMIRTLFQI